MTSGRSQRADRDRAARNAAALAASQAWRDMPVGTIFWARYGWDVGFVMGWHRTLWRREPDGIVSGWASHNPLMGATGFDGAVRDPWTPNSGCNPTLTIVPIAVETQAVIDMLLRHKRFDRAHELLYRLWVDDETREAERATTAGASRCHPS